MFYDLNIPWSPTDTQLPRTLAFLQELGYNAIALNHTISGKIPAEPKCPIPNPLPIPDLPADLTILRRCTLILNDIHSNARLFEIAKNYDIFAVRPIDEKSLQLACSSLDCDIISLDLTQRQPFWFKHKMLNEATRSGKKIELSYAQGVMGDANARRNVISNATQLIRASRGRGLILTSEAKMAAACRGPWDVVNLAAVWGLGQEKGFEAVSKECKSVVVNAGLKRTSFRGVIDVVYGGEKPAPITKEVTDGKRKDKGKMLAQGQKRKLEQVETANGDAEKPMSKRQMKKQLHAQRQAAKLQQQQDQAAGGAEQGGMKATPRENGDGTASGS